MILAIALGGAIGSVGRYLISGWITVWLGRGFPWGTLFVNVVGSFLMGALFQVFSERIPTQTLWRTALLVGLLGGFTTFSSFSLESLQLIQNGELRLFLINVGLSVLLCLICVWAGLSLARTV
ncbi:MAG: camphor resistance protein CrcB [Magnetococcales bacterium]|nr:camphor resistance protein CrcB [Magnetococcales bacterium]HIJ83477.1 fluoride efflux transporter CrcB [Magnetococcales bacterium]